MANEVAGVRYSICPGVLFSAVGAEGVLLNTVDGVYYGLDEVGVAAWQALAAGVTLATLNAQLLSSYDVPADRLSADLEQLVGELVAAGLLEVTVP